MSFTTRLALLLALLVALCPPACAADYEVRTNLLCDTREQAERFVALFNGDAEAAVVAVNAEEQDPTACALMSGPRPRRDDSASLDGIAHVAFDREESLRSRE